MLHGGNLYNRPCFLYIHLVGQCFLLTQGGVRYYVDGEFPAQYYFNITARNGFIQLQTSVKNDLQLPDSYTIKVCAYSADFPDNINCTMVSVHEINMLVSLWKV